MSWSVSMLGTPEKIVEALESEGDNHSGQSLIEYEAAKPALIALVSQSFITDEYKKKYPGSLAPILKLNASGSGTASGGEQLSRVCSVTIEPFYTKLLV